MNTEDNTQEVAPESNQPEQQQEPLQITAYNVKTKEKGCVMHDAVITKTAKGAYMAQGVSAAGEKLTTLMNGEKALKFIEAGIAKQGW